MTSIGTTGTILRELGPHLEQEAPEEIMLALDHLGVLDPGPCLQLDLPRVKPLVSLLSGQSNLPVRYEDAGRG